MPVCAGCAVAVLVLVLLGDRPAGAQAPPRVSAALSSPTALVGEPVTLTITIESRGAPEDVALPALPAALTIVGRSQSTELHFQVPGGRRRVLRQDLVLLPASPGTFTIPAAVVVLEGRRYRTSPLRLRVIASGTAAPGAAVGDAGVLLRVRVVPETVYVGQQAMLVAEAMFSDEAQLRLRSTPQYVPPTPSGFWVQEVPASSAAGYVDVGGRTFEVQRFRQAYFPLSAGSFALPPARLVYDLGAGGFAMTRTEELVSDSPRVVVLPLPAEGRPPGFGGAVGRYSIRARIEPAQLPVGEAAILTVEVEGEGNVKTLPPPALPPVAGIEAYSPSEEAEVDVAGGVIRGVKRFRWVLVPTRAGTLQVPPVTFAYFDPLRGEYDVARSSALELRATPVTGAGRARREDGIRPLLRSAGTRSLAWVRSPAFVTVQFFPLLVLGAVALARRRSARPRRPSPRALRAVLRAELSRLAAPDAIMGPDFFAALAGAMREWIAARLDEPALRSAGPEALVHALGERGVAPALTRALDGVLGRIERARYAPVPPDAGERRRLLVDVRDLAEAIDMQLGRRRRGRGAAAAIILLMLALPAPALANGQPEAYARGVAAFDAGDFAAAAGHFLAHTRANPGDAAAWYNLGTALWAADEPGRAIQAWLRSLRLAPRLTDARHNLSVAGVPPEMIDRVAPAIPVASEELLLGASALWFLAAGLTVLRVARSRRPMHLATAALSALALAALVASLHARRAPPVAVVIHDGAALLAAPARGAERLAALPDGAVLEVRGAEEGWVRVVADHGEGWVEQDAVGRP